MLSLFGSAGHLRRPSFRIVAPAANPQSMTIGQAG
jgi:hypothetical protein